MILGMINIMYYVIAIPCVIFIDSLLFDVFDF